MPLLPAETRDLLNTRPGHNKFYRITIHQTGNAFSVQALAGRIGTHGKQYEKGTAPTLAMARSIATHLADTKIAKGYSLVPVTRNTTTTISSVAEPEEIENETEIRKAPMSRIGFLIEDMFT